MFTIGQRSAELIILHQQHHSASSAFITAWNPFSDQTSPEQNMQRQAQLLREVHNIGLSWVQGEGKHPSGEWEGEQSLLLLGISLDDAKALGLEWEQNAIVWSDADGIPQLILLK